MPKKKVCDACTVMLAENTAMLQMCAGLGFRDKEAAEIHTVLERGAAE